MTDYLKGIYLTKVSEIRKSIDSYLANGGNIHYDSEALRLLGENSELKDKLKIAQQALVNIAMIDLFTTSTAEKSIDMARRALKEIGD